MALVISSAQITAGGYAVLAFLNAAADGAVNPVSPETGITGIAFSVDGVEYDPVTSSYTDGTNDQSVNFFFAAPILDGATVTVTASGSNLVDSFASAPLQNVSGFAVTNNSTLIGGPSGNDLISASLAIQNATLATLSGPVLAHFITAASEAISGLCKRTFTLTSYTDRYSGAGQPYQEIQLGEFPVTQIDRVATSPQSVLMIQNTSTANQRATVATTATGLKLVRVASAVSTPSTLAFSSYPTLTLLAAAITGLGNGWLATVATPYGNYASADLLPLQGAASAMNAGMSLELYTEDLGAWSATGFQFGFGSIGDGVGWRLDADTGYLVGYFPQGRLNIRVDYTAGYADIPEDIQEACVQMCQDLYQSSLINNNVSSAKLGPFSYTLANKTGGAMNGGWASLSPKVAGLLRRFSDDAKLIMRRGPD